MNNRPKSDRNFREKFKEDLQVFCRTEALRARPTWRVCLLEHEREHKEAKLAFNKLD